MPNFWTDKTDDRVAELTVWVDGTVKSYSTKDKYKWYMDSLTHLAITHVDKNNLKTEIIIPWARIEQVTVYTQLKKESDEVR